MWRRIGFSLVCFTAILWLLCIIFWIRGPWYYTESLEFSSPLFRGGFGTLEGHLILAGRVREARDGDPAWGIGFEQQALEQDIFPGDLWSLLANASDQFYSLVGVQVFTFDGQLLLAIPFAYPVVLFPLPIVWWTLRYRKISKHYRRKRGLCLACGYDLRATAAECPECGRAAPVVQPS